MKLKRKAIAPLITDDYGNEYPDAYVRAYTTIVNHKEKRLEIFYGIYKNKALALNGGLPIKTGALFFDEAGCEEVLDENDEVVTAGRAPFDQSIVMVNIGIDLTITEPMVQAWLLYKNRDPYGELWVTNWELDND